MLYVRPSLPGLARYCSRSSCRQRIENLGFIIASYATQSIQVNRGSLVHSQNVRRARSILNNAYVSSRYASTADRSSSNESTIFALSSAPGRAAIAIIRCTGPACLKIYQALCPRSLTPEPRKATVRKLLAPDESSLVLDPSALVLYFPAPRTVTGEDVIEFHLHGGRATVRAVLSAISTISSESHPIRPAEAGEFTQRAFYNGRMDLTQVESLGDTLSAETEIQRALAVNGSGGSSVLKERYESWWSQLLQARGELEALIDFSEDQHFDESPVELAEGVAEKVRMLLGQVEASIQNAARGELLRNGVKVALLGAPNVGKSSLLNRIVGREAAIVSSTAGTTRDVIETNVDINGFFCNLGDLAGIRASERGQDGQVGDIEQEGIRRAKARAQEADVVIVVRDIERLPNGKTILRQSKEVDLAIKELDQERQKLVYVINKADLIDNIPFEAFGTVQASESYDRGRSIAQAFSALVKKRDNVPICLVSCKRNQNEADGIQDLLAVLTTQFRDLTSASEIPGVTSSNNGFEESLGASERQASLLQQCRTHLLRFLESVEVSEGQTGEEIDIVMAAEYLREAARCFGKMTGQGNAGDVEEILGVVFEKFCVGK